MAISEATARLPVVNRMNAKLYPHRLREAMTRRVNWGTPVSKKNGALFHSEKGPVIIAFGVSQGNGLDPKESRQATFAKASVARDAGGPTGTSPDGTS